MLIIWISDPTVKTSILQTAYRNLTTPTQQAPSQRLTLVQKMYMHWQNFAKTSMDIMPIWIGNWIWKRISIIVKKLRNCFVIYVSFDSHSSTPSSEISDSSGKSSNSEGFSDNEHFDMSTKCFYPLIRTLW